MGSPATGTPLSTSLLTQVLADHRRAMVAMRDAAEDVIFDLPIERRIKLAIALSKLNYALRGGVL